jgi:hypothetical protein
MVTSVQQPCCKPLHNKVAWRQRQRYLVYVCHPLTCWKSDILLNIKGHEKEKDIPWNAVQQAMQTNGNPAVRQTSKRSHNAEHNGHNVVKKICTRITDWALSLIA